MIWFRRGSSPRIDFFQIFKIANIFKISINRFLGIEPARWFTSKSSWNLEFDESQIRIQIPNSRWNLNHSAAANLIWRLGVGMSLLASNGYSAVISSRVTDRCFSQPRVQLERRVLDCGVKKNGSTILGDTIRYSGNAILGPPFWSTPQ